EHESAGVRRDGAGRQRKAGIRGSGGRGRRDWRSRHHGPSDWRQVMNLSTTYLGMKLPSPLIVGSGPLGDEIDNARALEDAGASMIVLRSLFEEEVVGEQMDAFRFLDGHGESFAEASGFSPEAEAVLGPDEYLEHIHAIKSAVRIPVVASLCGMTRTGWISYARLIEDAGADALELHLYHPASDMQTPAAEVERQFVDLV